MALRTPVSLLGVIDGDHLTLASQVGLPDPWRERGHLPRRRLQPVGVPARRGQVGDRDVLPADLLRDYDDSPLSRGAIA